MPYDKKEKTELSKYSDKVMRNYEQGCDKKLNVKRYELESAYKK